MTENTFGIHVAGNDYPRATNKYGGIMEQLLGYCNVVKVLVNPGDAATINHWRNIAPGTAYFIGRDIEYDVDDKQLHATLKTMTRKEAAGLGKWFAENRIAPLANPHLGWMYWCSGPNEFNDIDEHLPDEQKGRWPAYCEAFTRRMLELGLMPAPGGWSYGLPPTPPFNTYDGWQYWQPVFELIDKANRDSAGRPYARPRAIFQLHEYAEYSFVSGQKHNNRRYTELYNRRILPNNLWVPLALGETGYAHKDGIYMKPPTTEVLLKDVGEIMAVYAQDPYFVGYAWYDFREKRNTTDNYSYMYNDWLVWLKSKNYTPRHITPPSGSPVYGGGVVVPPPVVDPEPPVETGPPFAMRVKDGIKLNFRQDAEVADNIWTVLPSGTQLKVWQSASKVAKLKKAKSGWTCVEFDGMVGFVASSYCDWL